jgi:hypothetical protein
VQYFYRVRACNSAGCSAYSDSADATTAATGGSSHILFVTSTTHVGNLGGLSGADLICSTRAALASLPGTWKAILSTATVNASSRISISGEIKNANDEVIAQDGTDLWDGSIDNPVRYDEFGNAQSGPVWTGTSSAGAGNGSYCGVWGNTAGLGVVGSSTAANSDWISATTDFCTVVNRIYCIDGQ